jgi:hypothetical protein
MRHTRIAIFMTTVLAAASLLAAGCSSSPLTKKTGGEEISQTGPTVLNPRTEPGTFEVTRTLKPIQTPNIFADVKDMTADIQNVRLMFNNAPITVPMQKVAGTTWRATLSPDQIKRLAVSGQTMKYNASIVATNSKGRQSQSAQVDILIKAPQIDATG